ncbi:MAG TPA: enolase C-terminal domain-like protein [Pirellulaceae bacterium]|nr:enolase C-terminal domain-like protein [Pirellulaceae bacterium]
MPLSRRDCLTLASAGALAAGAWPAAMLQAETSPLGRSGKDLQIKEVRITPIALPDPPLLAASGCHGPYFLRSVVEIDTADGITGIGETQGGQEVVGELQKAAKTLVGKTALTYRKSAGSLLEANRRAYAGVELACLDAIGKAAGLRLCDLFGGPVRDDPEFSSYLFFRYAADHPVLLADKRIVDRRGKGEQALDQWGEIRTPEAMAELAWLFKLKFGFRVHKLKAGVLAPEVELEALRAISERCGGKDLVRIDPNGRWSLDTALKVAAGLKKLPLEYYEDPVRGQEAMGQVRRDSGLKMSTNSCVVSFDDIPPAAVNKPVDVVLADHHYWGGIPACLALGKLAPAFGWSLSQHSNSHAGITMAAMIHVAATIPELTVASDTHYPWLIDTADIIAGGKLPIVGGRMKIPAGLGLGVELDRDKLAQAHETYQKCGMRDRDDETTMRMVQPGWERTIL